LLAETLHQSQVQGLSKPSNSLTENHFLVSIPHHIFSWTPFFLFVFIAFSLSLVIFVDQKEEEEEEEEQARKED
jgi:hypothetical protein